MKHFKVILEKNWRLAVAILTTSVLVSLTEGLSAGLVLPLLEGVTGQSNYAIAFPFNLFSLLFSGMTIIARIRLIALLLVIVTIIKGASMYFNNLSVCRLQMAVTKYFRMKCFDQLMNIGIVYTNKQRTAHLHTIAITHTENLGALSGLVSTLVSKIFTIIVLVAMLVFLSWKLTILSFFIVILSSFLLRRIAHEAEKAGKQFTESIKEVNRAMLDALLGMKVIRLFRREKDMARSFENKVDRVNLNMFTLTKTRRSIHPLLEVLGVIGLAVILITGSFLILPDEKGKGLEVILTFTLIFFRVLSPTQAFNEARVAIKGDLPFYREVYQFLESEDKPYIRNGSAIFKGLNKNIGFCDVEFGYNPQEAVVLRNLSFKIDKGAKVGIVGPSGGGKSTIVELFLRFYDPQKGKILVDDTDLRDLDINSWRKYVGVVTQDTFLFHDTVRANIAYAKPDATKEEIEFAAKQAFAHDFIRELPQGYDTLVGERGVLLSGGQKQRIAIARAIIMNPDILVFDEATSSLDTESEEIVQRALYEVGKGKTVISIAHRLSTVYDSNIILVIDAGKIVQQGTHQQLLEQPEGLYRRLVLMQSLDSQNNNILSR